MNQFQEPSMQSTTMPPIVPGVMTEDVTFSTNNNQQGANFAAGAVQRSASLGVGLGGNINNNVPPPYGKGRRSQGGTPDVGLFPENPLKTVGVEMHTGFAPKPAIVMLVNSAEVWHVAALTHAVEAKLESMGATKVSDKLSFEVFLSDLSMFVSLDEEAFRLVRLSPSLRLRVSRVAARTDAKDPRTRFVTRPHITRSPSFVEPPADSTEATAEELLAAHHEGEDSGDDVGIMLPDIVPGPKPKRPGTGVKFPLKRSVFSNSPAWGGYPLADEYEGGDLPTYVQIPQQLVFSFHQLYFFVRITISALHFTDVLICTAAALWAVFCNYMDWRGEVNASLFLSLLVFPLAFSVNSAYQRRENSLRDLSDLKGNAMSIFFCIREWAVGSELGFPFIQETSELFASLFAYIRLYLRCKYEPYKDYYLKGVYMYYSDVLTTIETVRKNTDVPPPLITRPMTDCTLMIGAFERLRAVTDYRTPASIRSYTKLFTLFLSFILGPYFANIFNNGSYVAAMAAAAGTPLMFVGLANVQSQLENPFGYDHDDINLDHIRSFEKIMNMLRLELERREGLVQVTSRKTVSHTSTAMMDKTSLHMSDAYAVASAQLSARNGGMSDDIAAVSLPNTAREEDSISPLRPMSGMRKKAGANYHSTGAADDV